MPDGYAPQTLAPARAHSAYDRAHGGYRGGSHRLRNDDYGSGTTLATTLANIAGTRELLTLLHPLLAPRYAGLPAVYSGLDRLQALLEKQHRPNGTWVPVTALPAPARQAIDAACGAVLQSLAPIASITEPRNIAHDF